MSRPIILAIDTSCDETSAAVTSGNQILSNVVASQINIHQKYGGVVPFLAKRAHEAKIEFVVKEALQRARINIDGKQILARRTQIIDAIAVTIGPGLAPALEVGIAYAKKLSQQLQQPIIPVNHLEGHLLSFLAGLKTAAASIFPALGLIVSGGHTQLVLVKQFGRYQLLGETLDDAAGEALDKLAKMLKLGYPGGPIIEQLAKQGNPDAISLPIPLQHSKELNFSFSGLKTAAMYLIQKQEKNWHNQNKFTYHLCASFQQAIAKSLTAKLANAIQQYNPKSILLGGGVFSNLYFRRQIRKAVSLPIFLPKNKKLFTDNAAMIGLAAQFHRPSQKLDRQPRLNFANQL